MFWADEYNHPKFIEEDPISIPHQYSKKQDIEISGFIAAILAWGQRKTIINSTQKIMERMDFAPHDFIVNHQPQDLKKFTDCKHRTFNYTDLLYFIHFLNFHYSDHDSLEDALWPNEAISVEQGLNHFNRYFFSLPEAPDRTQKHIAAPYKHSACKRLNMFLRWMVRKDHAGVDFGIWKKISMHKLIIPLDVHVINSIHTLWPNSNIKPNWKGAVEVTKVLQRILPDDPVKLDFALFGHSIAMRKQIN